jgi:hypothetical protein
MWRIIPGTILMLAFPAWFVWWIESPHILVYLYAVMLYAVVAALLMAWGVSTYMCQSE